MTLSETDLARLSYMKRQVTPEYWQEEGWYVGRLKGIPGVFSQGQTLQELEDVFILFWTREAAVITFSKPI